MFVSMKHSRSSNKRLVSMPSASGGRQLQFWLVGLAAGFGLLVAPPKALSQG